MLAHELIRGYHKEKLGCCAMKIDLQKAYDSVSWDFLEEVLLAFQFPDHFIKLIMSSVRSCMFSVLINGKLEGYFPGQVGLRQGDPISPLLLVLCMEYLTRCFNKMALNGFQYHRDCEELKLNHLCFADDLFVFAKGDIPSIGMINATLKHFQEVSGLKPNLQKSEVYFSRVGQFEKKHIINLLGFKKGTLPVKYLRLPLISTKLTKAHCQDLVGKITARISSWTVKTLSCAGRLQLVNSVLTSKHVYWCSVFILPKLVVSEVEKLCRNFLWHRSESSSRGGLVAWNVVCQMKTYGGLGIKPVQVWNQIAQLKHIWELIKGKQTLWAIWVAKTKLRRLSFWGITKKADNSWN